MDGASRGGADAVYSSKNSLVSSGALFHIKYTNKSFTTIALCVGF
jgi:hypothetical protein